MGEALLAGVLSEIEGAAEDAVAQCARAGYAFDGQARENRVAVRGVRAEHPHLRVMTIAEHAEHPAEAMTHDDNARFAPATGAKIGAIRILAGEPT